MISLRHHHHTNQQLLNLKSYSFALTKRFAGFHAIGRQDIDHGDSNNNSFGSFNFAEFMLHKEEKCTLVPLLPHLHKPKPLVQLYDFEETCVYPPTQSSKGNAPEKRDKDSRLHIHPPRAIQVLLGDL